MEKTPFRPQANVSYRTGEIDSTGGGSTPNAFLSNYANYRSAVQNFGSESQQFAKPKLADNKFYQEANIQDIIHQNLQERFGGTDKFFHTLLNGVVEDPDYAFRKDPRIYERMLRDPQINYCLQVRKLATASLAWEIVPPESLSGDPNVQKIADDCEQRLRHLPNMQSLIRQPMGALLPGIAAVELVWKYEKSLGYVVSSFYPWNKDRLLFDKHGNARLRAKQSPTTGLPVPPYKLLLHRVNVTDGSWANPNDVGYQYFGRGLADTPLYHYFFYKVTTLKYLLLALEKQGIPPKIVYAQGGNPQIAQKLGQVLQALKNDSIAVVPGSKEEFFVDTLRLQPNNPVFMAFIDYLDKAITRAILGQDLMTEMNSAHGSFAAAQVHKSVFDWIANADRTELEETLNASLIVYDMKLNAPKVEEKDYPHFRFKRAAAADPTAYLNFIREVVKLGLPVGAQHVRDALDIPQPGENEETINEIIEARMAQEQEQFAQQEQEQEPKQGITNNAQPTQEPEVGSSGRPTD
jgi:phage gp29-like protein